MQHKCDGLLLIQYSMGCFYLTRIMVYTLAHYIYKTTSANTLNCSSVLVKLVFLE